MECVEDLALTAFDAGAVDLVVWPTVEILISSRRCCRL